MLDFNPYTIVFTIINLLVLWLFLKHFLFGRVTAILDRRAQTVQSDLESAAQEKEQAEELRRQYGEQLSKTSQESAVLLAQSKAQAQREYEAVLEQARAEAQALLDTTRKQLEAERSSMGPVIDVEFPAGRLPSIKDALVVSLNGGKAVMEVAQHMSSGLSGSCQTAKALAADYPGRVFVVDNKRISVTLAQSVLDAQKLLREGISVREVHGILEREGLNASIYIAVNTLTYLKKSGRVTAAGAAMASFVCRKGSAES